MENSENTPVGEQTVLTRGQIDYKVQAIIGHYVNVSQPGRYDIPFPGFDNHPYYEVLTADIESESNTLTISIPDGIVSSSS